ncbi:MAG: endonuclease/exonuclease/phosphatase family protein [Saprospiraceae bacterium]
MISKTTDMSTPMKIAGLLPKAILSVGFSALLILVTGLCVFTPSLLLLRQLSDYTFYIMLGMLVLGFSAFLVRQERIMVVSLLCCCVLCLHLKGSANQQMRLAVVTSNPSLKISHISLGNAENDYDKVIDYIAHLDADIISFQELTPDWNAQLIKKLSPEYKYIRTMTRLDPYGMGFFSKISFHTLDTVYYHDVPALIGSIMLDNDHHCTLVSCTVIPPVNQAAFKTISKHFSYLTAYMKNLEGGVIVLGDLHLPPWAAEIQQFKIEANLQDSRRDTNPRNLDGSFSLPRIPVEHIFYDQKFECTSFSELGNSVVGRLGITGTYQIHNSNVESVQ